MEAAYEELSQKILNTYINPIVTNTLKSKLSKVTVRHLIKLIKTYNYNLTLFIVGI